MLEHEGSMTVSKRPAKIKQKAMAPTSAAQNEITQQASRRDLE